MATLPIMTLGEIRTAAQQRSDNVGASFVSDAEWTSFINESYFELYDMLVAADEDYFLSFDTSITTDGTNDKFSLAASFYKSRGVDVLVSGSGATAQYVKLKRFNLADRNAGPLGMGMVWPNRTNLRYRILGSTSAGVTTNKLWLAPFPAAGLSLRHLYIPKLTPLSSDSDTADGIGGWLEYVIVDSAIKALAKEESDVSVLMIEKQGLIKRIEAMSVNRDAGDPATVVDTYASSCDGFGGGYYWGP